MHAARPSNPGTPPPLAVTPTLLGIADACRSLGIGRSKLFVLLREGRLEARKLGRRTLIERASLERFVAALPAAAFQPLPGRQAGR